MIQILILGAGTAIPTPERNAAAYWVELDGQGILMDPGPGALIRLVQAPAGPDHIDQVETILLSHLHIDHCSDLVPLLFALHSPLPQATGPLQLFGPPGTLSFLKKLGDLYGSWIVPAKRELQINEILPGQVLVRDEDHESRWILHQGAPDSPEVSTSVLIEVFAAHHPQDRLSEVCLGFRFKDETGHSVVYSGDTESCPALLEASRETDLLLVECSTPDELATPGHMTPARVAELCQAARPGQVVLTHIYPPAAALDLPSLVGQHYSGPVVVARDGDLFQVPPLAVPKETS